MSGRAAVYLSALGAAYGVILRPSVPMKGWNSYDWGNGSAVYGPPNFAEIVDAADGMVEYLKPHGYEYFMVDGGWSFDGAEGDMDQYGRATPSLSIYPELKGSWAGVKAELAKRGLKFGLWFTNGMPTAAYKQNAPVKGTAYTAQDVALKDAHGNPVPGCSWNPGVYRVNTSHPGGVAYYASVVEQMEAWGVDYVKLDCVFAANMLEDDIRVLSTAMDASSAGFVLGLSPGDGVKPEQIEFARQYATTARIDTDFYANWHQAFAHYPLAARFASLAGQSHGFYLDMDILPFGIFRGQEPLAKRSPDTWPPIMVSIYTMWVMAQSPLLYGGDVRDPKRCPNPPIPGQACGIDNDTVAFLTHDGVISVSEDIRNSRMILRDDVQWTWAGDSAGLLPPRSKYVAVFNTWCGVDPRKADPPCGPPGSNMNGTVTTEVSAQSVGLLETEWFTVHDVWADQPMGYYQGRFSVQTKNLGAALMIIQPMKNPPPPPPPVAERPAGADDPTARLYAKKYWPGRG